MSPRAFSRILVWMVFAAPLTPTCAAEKKTNEVDFARSILPILSNKCFVCHGPDARDKETLRLDSFESATKDRGGYQAINADSPDESEVLARIHSKDDPMPPEDAEKQLTDQERSLLSRWIKQGGGYSKHWSFLPPKKTNPPADDSVEGEIDVFIHEHLKAEGIGFAPEADNATLARRVSLILTGLPPEPELLERFLADSGHDSYEKLVDQLMKSPRYGEHQARYWLDAVRYGDTHGLHLDNRRGIYPYRDWVVRAMQENLPLDEFIRWQVAGDLLPNPTLAQRVATGFVRMNPTTSEGGAIPAEFQAKNNFDRTENFGTVFLGMTLTCARCHTHKYDPIPQSEYYRLLAFFNSTAEESMDKNSYTYEPVLKAPQDQKAWDEWNRLESARRSLLERAEKLFSTDLKLTHEDQKKWNGADAQARLQIMADSDGPFAPTKLQALNKLQASDLQNESKELMSSIHSAEEKFTTTLVAKDLKTPRETRILERGEYDRPIGAPLEPGVLQVVAPFPADAPRNRLGLAMWLTSRENPLVSRVWVNRIWQRVFGEGLVRSPEDFGLQGVQPTHPELLDWLAVELQDSGWDLQHMLRLMVTSRTFRQESSRRSDVDDPANLLFARGPSHRLDAEEIRDIGLWASGLLDPQRGGEGVKPYQPDGMWMALAHPGSNTKKYERDKGPLLYRRSLYVYWKRTSPHPMMTLFDAPDRESSCVRRSRTSTSLQSLGLLNETQRVEMARALAERLLRERDNDEARLDMLFSLLACRKANEAEQAACANLFETLYERYKKSEKDAIDLLSIGDAKRDESLNVVDHAAWTQVVITVLASDVGLMLY